MSTRPMRRSDVWTVTEADEALVYDPGRRRLHRLNSSAAALWALLDGTRAADAVAGEVADRFGVTPEAIAGDLTALLDDLRGEGLLAGLAEGETGGTAPPGFVPPRAEGLAHTAERILRGRTWTHELGPFHALGFGFSIRAEADDVASPLLAILQPLRAREATAEHQYTVRSAGTGHLVSLDGRRLGRFSRHEQVVNHLVWHVNQMAISSTLEHTLFHAAGVVRDGGGLLLPGTSNAGKSTLAAALVADGWDYLSDEAVALGPDSDMLLPYPKALTLQAKSVGLLGLTAGTTIGPDRHVPAESIRSGSTADPTAVRLVVSPRHAPGAEPEAVRLDRLDAVALLLESAFHLRPGRAAFDRLVDLATALPVYTLRFDTPGEALLEIDRIARDGGDPGDGESPPQ